MSKARLSQLPQPSQVLTWTITKAPSRRSVARVRVSTRKSTGSLAQSARRLPMPARRKATSKPPKAKHRKATRDPTPEEEYQVRGILDEKVERGKLFYLVDWEDSPEGQSYDPTWEPAKHVNELAINEWEAEKKKKKLAVKRQESRKRSASSVPEAAEDEDEEDDARPAKRAKGDDSGYTSPELELGVEVDNIPKKAGQQLVLEIHPPSQLDPDDYQLFTASQLSFKNSSQHDSASHTNSNESSSGKVLSQRTIPDSQATGESEPTSTIPETVLASQSQEQRLVSVEREQQQALDSQVESEQLQQAESEQLQQAESEEHGEEQLGEEQQQKVGQNPEEEQSKEQQKSSQEEESQTTNTLNNDEAISVHLESLIPSRQPDPSGQPDNHNRSHEFREENNHSQCSTFSGFLTQPDYAHLNNSDCGEVASATVAEADQGKEVNRDSQVTVNEHRSTSAPVESSIPSASNAPRADSPQVSSPEPSSSGWQSQQAQLVDPIVPLSSNFDQIQTQTQTQTQERSQSVEEIVPETAQKERAAIATANTTKLPVSDTHWARAASSGSVPPRSSTFPTTHILLRRSETEPLRPVSASHQSKMGPTPPPAKEPDAVDALRAALPDWMLHPEPEPEPVPEPEPAPEPAVQSHNPEPSFPVSEEVQSQTPQPSFPVSEEVRLQHPQLSVPMSELVELQHPQQSFRSEARSSPPSPITAPISSRSLPQRSAVDAVDALRESIGLHNGSFLEAPQSDHPPEGLTLSSTELPVIGTHHHRLEMEYENLPTTVAPSDLTTSADLSRGVDEGPAMSNPLFSVHDVEPLGAATMDSDHEEAQDMDENPIELRQFVVTLPMAANTRSLYVDTIALNLQVMTEFGNAFCDSASQVPDDALTARIDGFFNRLNDLVDLPAFDDDTFHQLNSEGMLKHAINSNSKFSFVYEFLKTLRWLNFRILIVSRPGRPLKYLEEIVAQEIPQSPLSKTYAVLSTESPEHVSEQTSVIVAEAGQDLSKIGGQLDVVILFDHEARQVNLPSKISYESTIFLSLATICSLEHILLQLREMASYPEMSPLEIRNALCQVTALLVRHLKDPQHAPPPHEVAVTFASFLENPENDIDYVSQPLPISVEEMWESQPQTQADNAELSRRKRPLDDDQDVMPKRRKTGRASSSVPMSELLRDTLARHPVSNVQSAELAEVPVAQLEAMAFQIFKLESLVGDLVTVNAKLREHTDPLEKELESWRGTLNTLHVRYTDALNDRSDFEKECKQAKKVAAAATDKLEAVKAEVASLREHNKTLESKLAEATLAMEQSTVPDIARFAQLEKELAETKTRAEKAEKKAAALSNEADFVRQNYQNASSYQQEQNDEMKRLREEIADLRTRANDNIVKIQQIHAANELADHQRQLAELQALVRDRERELDVSRAENQQLKNGRRETRGGSTPRSPRIGAMGGVMPSPRPGRAGAGSRGTSPAAAASSDPAVPGMTYAPAGANGRWNHLRD